MRHPLPLVIACLTLLACGRARDEGSPGPTRPTGRSSPTVGAFESVESVESAPALPTVAPSDPLAAQLAATPAWSSSLEPEASNTAQQVSTVPQLREGSRHLEAIERQTSESVSGVLVCHVSIARDRDWDSAGLFGRNVAPDVSAYLRIDDGTEVRARLPEDAYEGVASVPGLALTSGSRIGIRLVDRDVSFDDPIAAFELVWPATWPAVVTDGPATVRCGVLDDVVARREAADALATASRLLDRQARVRPRVDLLRAPTAAPTSDTGRIRGGIREAASFVGYAHPDVTNALARLASVEGAFEAAHREAVESALRRARPPGTNLTAGRAASAVVRGFACASRASVGSATCSIRLDATYTHIPNPPGFATTLETMLLLPGARATSCTLDLGQSELFVRRTGAESHVYACYPDALPADGPTLLRISHGSSAVLARAR